MSIVQKQAQVTVTTDASKTGYGGHMDSKIVQGEWSEEQKGWHINFKSDLKWCIHLSRSLYSYFNYLVSVTAGGPRSPRGHM